MTTRRDQMLVVIEMLKNANESSEYSGSIFHRICFGCNRAEPEDRFVSTHCGHMVCRECTDASPTSCPYCKKETTFIRLVENEEYSRKCGICLCENPPLRDVFRLCGHSCCTACSSQLFADAVHNHRSLFCPICQLRTKSEPILLRELVNPTAPEGHLWKLELHLEQLRPRLRFEESFARLERKKLQQDVNVHVHENPRPRYSMVQKLVRLFRRM